MGWLPRISTHSWMACDDDGEVEGYSVRLRWHSWEIELDFGRHNRRCR
jgi:hypothetical protein